MYRMSKDHPSLLLFGSAFFPSGKLFMTTDLFQFLFLTFASE